MASIKKVWLKSLNFITAGVVIYNKKLGKIKYINDYINELLNTEGYSQIQQMTAKHRFQQIMLKSKIDEKEEGINALFDNSKQLNLEYVLQKMSLG